MAMHNGSIYAALGQYSCNLRRTVALLHTELENLSHDFCAFLVYNPFLFIFGSFPIPEWRYRCNVLARIPFGADNRFDIFAAIFGVHFVEYVLERCNIVVGVSFAVQLIVDRDKPYVGFRKIIFRVVAYKNMVSPNLNISLTITVDFFRCPRRPSYA